MGIDYLRQGHLVTITLDRPARLNAIDEPMLDALREAWQRYDDDDEAWLAILAARGRVFCAGADKGWFEGALAGDDALGRFLAATRRDRYWSGAIDKPTLVAIDGPVLGAGVDLVLRADLRVAARGTSLRMPEVDRGNFMILWDNLPYAIAAEMIAGAEIDAERAHQVGLVNRLAPPGRALAVATAWAQELLAKPPLALRQGLKMLRQIRNANTVPPMAELREQATAASRRLTASADWRESVDAFLARRPPDYHAR
jgi:enoyl-CoA hydratase/carnithine racemase